MEKILLYFSLKYNGNWDKIYNALEKKEKILHSQLEETCQKIDCDFLTILSPLYPNFLKSAHKPPFVIFYKGNIELLSKYNKTISIVGGQKYSEKSINNTYRIVKELINEKRVIVTYQKEGTNNQIISLCREENFENIVILAESMKTYIEKTKNINEKENKLFICEVYEFLNNQLTEEYEEYLNRMLCGISKGILFTPYNSKDSYFSLVNYAINEGKEIFAIPTTEKEFNETNKLIKMGAKFTENAKDIVNLI
ncbi:DNA-processing protein DprA [Spiroplasma tabanidicola]|uniref:DNA processing/uptake protein n=1 Tax=Spiroplasma tabanidicola TaxID=324079 RepID=A0A6I6CCB0_9MOLU|nr:DNA-processing protein DprA [Spiroplasma tabanidicola]QGS51752.1 DNA processing/uptake protein [Spiroplasma tabanidicola]